MGETEMRKGEILMKKFSVTIALVHSHNNLAKEVLLIYTDEKTTAQICEMGSLGAHSLKTMGPEAECCFISWDSGRKEMAQIE